MHAHQLIFSIRSNMTAVDDHTPLLRRVQTIRFPCSKFAFCPTGPSLNKRCCAMASNVTLIMKTPYSHGHQRMDHLATKHSFTHGRTPGASFESFNEPSPNPLHISLVYYVECQRTHILSPINVYVFAHMMECSLSRWLIIRLSVMGDRADCRNLMVE